MPERKWKMRVYTMRPEGMGSCCEKDLSNVLEILKHSQINETWEIAISEMPEEEYNNLPEFNGF